MKHADPILGLLVKKEKQPQEICIFKHLTTKYVIINMYMKFKQIGHQRRQFW